MTKCRKLDDGVGQASRIFSAHTLGGEPEAAELARVLPAARARVAEVTRVARTMRRASSAALGAGTAAEIAPLQVEVEREVAALDAGIHRLLALAARA